jgi:hypothetical protein
MEWTKAGGALHLTPEECETAPAVLELRGPQPELPEDRARAEQLLLSHAWKVATSPRYAKLPHAYTLRRTWANAEDFVWTVEHIRRVGYQERFIGRTWIYYDMGEHQYWDCGGPMSGVGLINRAVRRPASARRTRQGPSTLT